MPVSPPFPVASSHGIPLIITRRQRAELRERGFSDDDIRVMTPAEAHRFLAEARTASVEPSSG